VVVALATGLRWALDPALGDGVALILYYFTVVFCAWYGGLRQGLLATALSALIARYLFIPSAYWFANKGPHVLPRLITYLLALGGDIVGIFDGISDGTRLRYLMLFVKRELNL